MKHKAVRQSSFYKVHDGKVEKIRRTCPRCGESVFMAEHKDRYYCGTCRYTEWKKTNSNQSKTS